VVGQPHWSDIWFYAVGPTVIYAAMAAASWAVWSEQTASAMAVAGVLVALLMLGIRNAWDLVTWLAPKPDKGEPGADA
jgi:tryptophan-rich sensory protein